MRELDLNELEKISGGVPQMCAAVGTIHTDSNGDTWRATDTQGGWAIVRYKYVAL